MQVQKSNEFQWMSLFPACRMLHTHNRLVVPPQDGFSAVGPRLHKGPSTQQVATCHNITHTTLHSTQVTAAAPCSASLWWCNTSKDLWNRFWLRISVEISQEKRRGRHNRECVHNDTVGIVMLMLAPPSCHTTMPRCEDRRRKWLSQTQNVPPSSFAKIGGWKNRCWRGRDWGEESSLPACTVQDIKF